MTTKADVLAALHDARAGVPAVVRRLMGYFDIRGRDVADALGLSSQTWSMRLSGTTVIKQEELRALAVFFGVPTEVFYLSPDDALRWVMDHRQEVEAARFRSRCSSSAA